MCICNSYVNFCSTRPFANRLQFYVSTRKVNSFYIYIFVLRTSRLDESKSVLKRPRSIGRETHNFQHEETQYRKSLTSFSYYIPTMREKFSLFYRTARSNENTQRVQPAKHCFNTFFLSNQGSCGIFPGFQVVVRRLTCAVDKLARGADACFPLRWRTVNEFA